MKWDVKDTLTDEEIRVGLRFVIKDAVASQAVLSLTTGPFLVAFALLLGASNLTIGILAAIPPLAQLVQIPAVYLIERWKTRRAVVFYACITSKAVLLVMGLATFVLPHHVVLFMLVPGLLLYGSIGAFSSCAWNGWMRDLIPIPMLGEFNARRLKQATLAGVILTFVAGYYVEWFGAAFPASEVYTYSTLFMLCFLIAIVNARYIAAVPEPRLRTERIDIVTLILHPFRDTDYKRLLIFLASWNVAVNVVGPFFTVFMLKRLELSVMWVVTLTVFSQAANLVFFPVWGKLSDRFGNKTVLSVCTPMFVITVLFWIVASIPASLWPMLILLIVLHVTMGIATAGTTLGTLNIALKLAPKEMGAAYMAAGSIVSSIAAGLAPIMGCCLVEHFAGYSFDITLDLGRAANSIGFQAMAFSNWDLFFFLAFLIGCHSIFAIGRVREEGDVGRSVLVHEMLCRARRRLSNLPLVRRICRMAELSSSLLRGQSNQESPSEAR